ncbi:hypothetical protein DBR11_23175 [Pedobacter sp. HMWF019]|uniref:hypothetical protein n=1 Tax=Pedobacter sp. HMWF019 TaxID=2056856 RepID=UPI000D3CFF1B|nr:hypothetical protein [Pedobacter sp. HMWF019]PTS94477.1 hypothetical protein DBR11_23175 [Pedobacter sp. HMWF019]
MRKWSIFVLWAFVFLSCRQISKSIDETINPIDSVADKQQPVTTVSTTTSTTHSVMHREGENIGFLTDTLKLLQAEVLLRKLPQYAGKEIYVYSSASFFDDGRIFIALQHPTNPKYVDNYQYEKDKWTGPKPEQLSVKDDIKNRLVPLSQMNFINVSRIGRIYNKKASEIEGATLVTHIYVNIWNNTMQWFPNSISGSRKRYLIEFNTDGTLKSFKQG